MNGPPLWLRVALAGVAWVVAFAFGWHAFETGNGHVVYAVLAYLLLVLAVLLVVVWRRSR